jgi:NO-binding membrane sensor protein with MHYT domain
MAMKIRILRTVAQRVGFRFAAVANTVIVAAVFAIVGVAFIRRSNPMWILIVPAIGGLGVAGCFMSAGHYANMAAISVEHLL